MDLGCFEVWKQLRISPNLAKPRVLEGVLFFEFWGFLGLFIEGFTKDISLGMFGNTL